MTCNLNLVFNQQHIATQSKKSLARIYAHLKKLKDTVSNFFVNSANGYTILSECPVAKDAL